MSRSESRKTTQAPRVALAGLVAAGIWAGQVSAQEWMGYSVAAEPSRLFNRCDNHVLSGTWYCQQIQSYAAPRSPSEAIRAAAWVRAVDRGSGHRNGGHSIGILSECSSWHPSGRMRDWYCLASEARILNKVDRARYLIAVRGQLSGNSGVIDHLLLGDFVVYENAGSILDAIGVRTEVAANRGSIARWTSFLAKRPRGDVGYAVGLRIDSGYTVGIDAPSPIRIRSKDESESGELELIDGELYFTTSSGTHRIALEPVE